MSQKTHVLNSLCLIGSISNLTIFFQAHLTDPSLFLFLFKIYSQQLLDFLTCAKSISPLTGKVPCLIHNPKVRAEAQDTFSSFVKKKTNKPGSHGREPNSVFEIQMRMRYIRSNPSLPSLTCIRAKPIEKLIACCLSCLMEAWLSLKTMSKIVTFNPPALSSKEKKCGLRITTPASCRWSTHLQVMMDTYRSMY